MLWPVMAIIRFLQRLRRVYLSVWGPGWWIIVETWWWPLQAETCSFIIRICLSKQVVLFDYTSSLSLVTNTTGMTHHKGIYSLCYRLLLITGITLFQINARRKNDLHLPQVSLAMYQKGVYYSGIKIFNALPKAIKDISRKTKKFKIALKHYLLTHSFYSLD